MEFVTVVNDNEVISQFGVQQVLDTLQDAVDSSIGAPIVEIMPMYKFIGEAVSPCDECKVFDFCDYCDQEMKDCEACTVLRVCRDCEYHEFDEHDDECSSCELNEAFCDECTVPLACRDREYRDCDEDLEELWDCCAWDATDEMIDLRLYDMATLGDAVQPEDILCNLSFVDNFVDFLRDDKEEYDEAGYPLFYLPDHPFTDLNGFVQKHRLVLEALLNFNGDDRYLVQLKKYPYAKFLPYVVPVKHRDGDITNWHHTNLEVIENGDGTANAVKYMQGLIDSDIVY